MTVHISISDSEVKFGKQNFLSIHNSLVNYQKRLENYQKIRKKEIKLKLSLISNFKYMKKQINQLQILLPEIEEELEEMKEETKEDTLDELEEIKNKLGAFKIR